MGPPSLLWTRLAHGRSRLRLGALARRDSRPLGGAVDGRPARGRRHARLTHLHLHDPRRDRGQTLSLPARTPTPSVRVQFNHTICSLYTFEHILYYCIARVRFEPGHAAYASRLASALGVFLSRWIIWF